MTRTQRSLLYVGAGLITGIVVAMIVLLTMSRTQFGMERVRLFAVSWLTERVDGEVHVGSIGGSGLLGGVTLREFYIIDKLGRPFMRMDSARLSYNWRTLARGQIVIEDAVLYEPELYFEQLPGDTMWNFQRVFPDRSKPGETQGPRRLIMFDGARVVNGFARVLLPFESVEEMERDERLVVDTLPGGFAKVMRFDSLNGQLSRIIWESPSEKGRLFDVRSMRGRAFIWRDPMHITGMRGTVTMRDTVVAFDMPDFRLPSSRGSIVGRVIMEEGQNFFDVRIDMPSFTFSDLTWLYPRLPESGGGSGTLLVQSQRPKGILWLAKDARLNAPGTRVAGSFGVVTGADSLYFTNVDLRASPLDLDLIQSMLPKRLPLDGLLVGTVEVKGGLSSLETKGDMQLGSSGVKWRGTLDVRKGIAARNFRADLRSLDLALVQALRPQLKLRGQLTGNVEGSGSASNARFAADVHHYLSGYTSSFQGDGTYTNGDLDVRMNARPLSLEELARTYPALERLKGEARGPIQLSGSLTDLVIKADLETQGGRAQLDGRLTRDEIPRYSGDATLYSFRLDQLISELPETVLDGKIAFDIAGTNAANVRGRAGGRLSRAEIRGLDFLDTHAAMTLDGGAARIDTFSTTHALLGKVSGAGVLSISEARTDTLTFEVRNDSTTGEIRGAGTLIGSRGSFDLDANVDIKNLNFRSVLSDRVTARITGKGLGGDNSRFDVRGRADSVTAFGERADTAAFAFRYSPAGGDVRIFGGSASGDEYAADAGVQFLEEGLRFAIRDLRTGQRATPWKLAAPSVITKDAHGLNADSIEIRREDGGRVSAAGRIAWHDASHSPEAAQSSDFRLNFEGVPFAEFALATAGAADVQGTLDGGVVVTGNAVAPLINGHANVKGFMLGDAALEFLSGKFTYADQMVRVTVDADRSGKRVLAAEGTIPLDLAFLPVTERRLNRPMRVAVNADSLPATFITAMLEGFTDVRGRVDGLMLATGTTLNPKLSGAWTLLNGDASWLITGVRYRDVGGTIRLSGDRTASLEAEVKANGGSAHVSGTIDLTHPRDPGLNLTMDATNFLASQRRDAEVTASGRIQLDGRFRQPVVSGAISVDRGALFLDEMYRRFQIVELENPLLYDVVDTSLVSIPTILRTRNPFIKNLTVRDLRVSVGRESWLRSRDLNVEVGGDLTIAFLLSDTMTQRSAQDLRLTGTLRAARGTYQLAGPGISRRFTIREGTIEFPGTPGVDPGLGFNAVYRARSSRQDEPIDIIAVVGGTLRSPQIRLTSDDENLISESDLASYLFFGVPTYELTASQSEAVSQATAGFSFAASSGFGYLASSLQTFAQNFGLLDYVSLTAAEVGIHPQGAIASLFAGTRLELGRYVGGDGQVYIAYSQSLTANGYRRPGVRVEWQVRPTLTGELFVEDRFARTPNFGIQDLSPKRVYGLFLFREWAY